jgi:hypothetical protein
LPNKLTLTTVQGQAWDQLAKARLGTEFSMHKLLAANFKSRGVLLFSGDVSVNVPATEAEAAKSPTESLPPWKR